MPSKISGKTVLSADVAMPYVGAWHADLSIDAAAILTGKVTFDFETVPFVGTVVRSGLHGGRLGVRMVGGAGGLSNELGVVNYASAAGTTVGTVLADIVRESSESLSSTSDTAVLGQALAKWHRTKGPASAAITALVEAARASWRVLRDGTIWVGKLTWPTATPKHVLIDEDWVAGIFTLAPEAPDLEPGTTFLGQRIDTVIHRLSPNALRTDAHVDSPGSAVNRFLAGIRRQIDTSRLYPARVSMQNADGTLQLVPDDDKVKGAGLDQVPYLLGVPGSVKVSSGQRVLFGWKSGDPLRPYAIGWEKTDADELALLAGTDFVALAALVDANFKAIKDMFASWVVVPQDGGAALKALTGSLLLPSVKAAKVKAE